MLTWFLNLVMQCEAMDKIEAAPYERADTRKAHRNGYKNRSLKTRVCEFNLKKPQFGRSSFKRKSLKDIRALRRFSVSILIDINKEWMTTKMYLNIDAD